MKQMGVLDEIDVQLSHKKYIFDAPLLGGPHYGWTGVTTNPVN